jgi:hypothetical protein
MTPNCKEFIRSVIGANWNSAVSNLKTLTMTEMLQSLASIDPLDLEEVAKRVDTQKTKFACSVVKSRKIPSQIPSEVTKGELDEARRFVALPSHLKIVEDLTGFLPKVNNPPGTLTEGDFEKAAKELNVEVSAIMAVAQVEAGGRKGFASDFRPIIRYELHIFHKMTQGIYHKTHPHLSQPTFKAGNPYHTGKQIDEWRFIHAAMLLRDVSGRRRYSEAWQSASWGMFQVMGINFRDVGWSSIEEFVSDMFKSEENHLKAFIGYCKHKGIIRYIRDRNWDRFAYYYNGTEYKEKNTMKKWLWLTKT